MARDDKAEVTHRHTTSDIRGGRFPEGMLPSTIIPSIEAAQATAASKSKVIFSTLTASGTNFSEGDTWYQRITGLIIAQWEFTGGAWASRTLDGAVVANLDASKITTGTLAAGTKITAGNPLGSRVELDEAGLRKYAADGTTVQVDLTGEVAAFSGLITGSEILGGTFRTAASGPRVEILSTPPQEGEVQFYSGDVNETSPASVVAGAWGDSGYASIISPGTVACPPAGIYLAAAPPGREIDLRADYIFTEASHVDTSVSALETCSSIYGNTFLMRRIFVVADATERAWLVFRYVQAPNSRVIDSAHPLFVWQADEAPGAQLQYTVDGTTFAAVGGGGGGGTTLFADPNADRLVFWDDSAGAFAPLTASTGLTLTGTDLTVRAATDAQTGIVELATDAETIAGTDTFRAVTSAGVKAVLGAAGGVSAVGASAVGPFSAATTLVTAPAITADGVKKYKVTGYIRCATGTVAGDVFDLSLVEVNSGVSISGAAAVPMAQTSLGVYSSPVTIVVPHTPAAGSRVYRLAGVRSGGTGTATMYDSKIIVEQIGGSGGGGGGASETAAGIVELATSAETVTGTDTVRAVTPAGVKAVLDKAWTAYTPTLTASTTNPNIGTTGSRDAAYLIQGKLLYWRAVIGAGGTGIAAGSGPYFLAPPIAPTGGYAILGQGWIYGAAGFKPFMVDSTNGRLIRMDATPGSEYITNAQGLVAGSAISASGFYQIA